jgi:hypothetical protein
MEVCDESKEFEGNGVDTIEIFFENFLGKTE